MQPTLADDGIPCDGVCGPAIVVAETEVARVETLLQWNLSQTQRACRLCERETIDNKWTWDFW